MLKKLVESERFRAVVGTLLAAYYRLVNRSCRAIVEPADYIERIGGVQAVIATTWHGEHFMVPFARPSNWPAKAMISRSRDGALNVAVAEKLGVGAIRASGGRSGKEVRRRGGVSGFVAAVRELEAGTLVMMTADVPKTGKIVGEGIIQIARHSGKPIVPLATVTTNRKRFSSWDRAVLNLPFGRFVTVFADPIRVAPDAGPEEIEAKRLEVQAALERITARAYELAGGRDV